MVCHRYEFFIFLWSWIVLVLWSSASYGEAVGLVTASRGPSTLIRNEQEPSNAQRGTKILVGDMIRLSPQSTLQLTFIDRSTLSLTGGAELVVRDFVFGKGKKPSSKLKITHGTFSFLAGQIAKIAPESYRIETETATIGIRGSGGTGVTSPQGLLIMTQAGHVLEILSNSGQWRLVDVPMVGLAVQASGACSPLPITQDLWELRPEAIQEERALGIPWAPLLPRPYEAPEPQINAQAIFRRQRIEVVHESEENKNSPCKVRGSQNVLQDPETSSANPLMRRLAAEQQAAEEAKSKMRKKNI